MLTTISVLLALLLDRLLGEPKRWHPLVLFGNTAQRLENFARSGLSKDSNVPLTNATGIRWRGALCWLLLVLVPSTALYLLLSFVSDTIATVVAVLVLYLCIGGRSLAEHAHAVQQPLERGHIADARIALSMIVSRDTATMDEASVAGASVESVLENGSDALLAPLFWFVLAGAPGVLCYRLCNTLDAMWGYRSATYIDFGYVAARADDYMNRPPAVLCALAYALCGHTRMALSCWSRQAPACDSPNAGPVMASGAGGLGLRLGGAAYYAGELHQRPTLGEGRPAIPADISKALSLLWQSLALLIAAVALLEFLQWI